MKLAPVLVAAIALAACDGGAPAADTPPDSTAMVDDTVIQMTPSPAHATSDPAVAAWLARVDSSVYTRWGACPFECCVYRDWVAQGPVVVREHPNTSAPIVLTIPVGERFDADSGFVRITSAQLVVVTAPVEAYRVEVSSPGGVPDSLAAGDTVLVLEPEGEGHYLVTDGEHIYSAEQFWPGKDGWQPYGGAKGTTLGEHAAEWWAHIWTAGGQSGWIDADHSELGNVDGCGTPE